MSSLSCLVPWGTSLLFVDDTNYFVDRSSSFCIGCNATLIHWRSGLLLLPNGVQIPQCRYWISHLQLARPHQCYARVLAFFALSGEKHSLEHRTPIGFWKVRWSVMLLTFYLNLWCLFPNHHSHKVTTSQRSSIFWSLHQLFVEWTTQAACDKKGINKIAHHTSILNTAQTEIYHVSCWILRLGVSLWCCFMMAFPNVAVLKVLFCVNKYY